MRKMSNGKQTINVIEWIITQNGWEYYVIEIDENDMALCLVMGFETEIGYVDLEEIKPFINFRVKTLDMQPALGWMWVEEKIGE